MSNKTIVTKILEFDAGHRLVGHESKCAYVHGHRYKVEITAEATGLDQVGRVIDFSVLKQKIGFWLDANWDHSCIVNAIDHILVKFLSDNNQRRFLLPYNPTAENMAFYLLQKANELVYPQVKVIKIKLWETPTCYAEVEL